MSDSRRGNPKRGRRGSKKGVKFQKIEEKLIRAGCINMKKNRELSRSSALSEYRWGLLGKRTHKGGLNGIDWKEMSTA